MTQDKSAYEGGSPPRAGTIAPPGRGLAFSTLGSPGASMSELVAIAGRGGCGGVELRSAPGEVVNTELAPAEVRQIREQLAAADLAVLAVATYVRLCAPVPESGVDSQVEDLVAQIDLAAAIGAGGVRVFMSDESAPGTEGPSEGEQVAVQRLATVTDLCNRSGVSVLIETHDTHSLGTRVAAFLALLDVSLPGHRCGVIWDTAHSWAHGESPADTLHLLRKWLAYLQIKDVRSAADPEPVMLGEGSYPIAGLADAVRRLGWEGWICLEWERTWHPDLPPIDVALSEAKVWAEDLIERQGKSQL